MINPDAVALCAVMHQARLIDAVMRRVATWTLERFDALGMEPDRFAGHGPGMPEKYVRFRTMRKELESADFAGVSFIAFKRMLEGGAQELSEWSAHMSASRSGRRDDADFAIDPTAFGIDFDEAESHCLAFARTFTSQYGYIFKQRKRLCPMCYAIGLGYGHVRSERHRDHQMNISWWTYNYPVPIHVRLLRDIYFVNFLGAGYLDAPVGDSGLTLREWIHASSARGIVRPFTADLVEWRPPAEEIPAIRESLYRAGRIFYWRFFDPSDPLYRSDLLAPWKAVGETPEVYAATFFEQKAPDLIY